MTELHPDSRSTPPKKRQIGGTDVAIERARWHEHGRHVLLSFESVVAALKAFLSEPHTTVEKRFVRIRDYDKDVRAAVAWVVRESDSGRGSLLQRSGPWPAAISHVFGALLDAYQHCIDAALGEARPHVADSVLRDLHWRLIRAAADRVKWERYAGGPGHGELWTWAGAACRHAMTAEAAADSDGNVPASFWMSSPGREYIRAVTHFSVGYDVIAPDLLSATERLVEMSLATITLQPGLPQGASCYLPHGLDSPPRRIIGFPDVEAGAWFLHTASARAALVTLSSELGAARGSSGESGDHQSTSPVRRALRHLMRQWSDVAPARRSRRHSVEGELHAVKGFESLERLLAGGQADELAGWSFRDVSRTGVGAWVAPDEGSQVSVGDLVGIRPSEGRIWHLGVIRRTWREADSGVQIGLRTLSRAPVLGRIDNGSVASAVLVCDPVVKGEPVRLVVPRGLIHPGASLFFISERSVLKLKPLRQGITAEDFELWSCQVL